MSILVAAAYARAVRAEVRAARWKLAAKQLWSERCAACQAKAARLSLRIGVECWRAEKAEAEVARLKAELTAQSAKAALAVASWKAAEEELQTVARDAAVAALREPRRALWENEVDNDIAEGRLVWNREAKDWIKR